MEVAALSNSNADPRLLDSVHVPPVKTPFFHSSIIIGPDAITVISFMYEDLRLIIPYSACLDLADTTGIGVVELTTLVADTNPKSLEGNSASPSVLTTEHHILNSEPESVMV